MGSPADWDRHAAALRRLYRLQQIRKQEGEAPHSKRSTGSQGLEEAVPDSESNLHKIVAMGLRLRGEHEHAAMRAARAAAADEELAKASAEQGGASAESAASGAGSAVVTTAISDFARRVLRPN